MIWFQVRLSTLHILTLFPVSVPVPMQQDGEVSGCSTVLKYPIPWFTVPIIVFDIFCVKVSYALVHYTHFLVVDIFCVKVSYTLVQCTHTL